MVRRALFFEGRGPLLQSSLHTHKKVRGGGTNNKNTCPLFSRPRFEIDFSLVLGWETKRFLAACNRSPPLPFFILPLSSQLAQRAQAQDDAHPDAVAQGARTQHVGRGEAGRVVGLEARVLVDELMGGKGFFRVGSGAKKTRSPRTRFS